MKKDRFKFQHPEVLQYRIIRNLFELQYCNRFLLQKRRIIPLKLYEKTYRRNMIFSK